MFFKKLKRKVEALEAELKRQKTRHGHELAVVYKMEEESRRRIHELQSPPKYKAGQKLKKDFIITEVRTERVMLQGFPENYFIFKYVYTILNTVNGKIMHEEESKVS